MKQQENSVDSPPPKMYRWVCRTRFSLFCLLFLFTPAHFLLCLRILSFIKVFFFFLFPHCFSLSLLQFPFFHLSSCFLFSSFIHIRVFLRMSFICIVFYFYFIFSYINFTLYWYLLIFLIFHFYLLLFLFLFSLLDFLLFSIFIF